MSGKKWESPRPSRSKPSEEERARQYVFRLLAVRPRTERELRERLRRRGFPAAIVDQTLTWAPAEGLVDDALFARLYAESELVSRPRSRRLLAWELHRRGVDGEAARAAAEGAYPELSEEKLAEQALAQRRKLWAGLPREKALRRATAFLLRRGFDPDLVQELVEKEFGPFYGQPEGGVGD